MPEKGDGYGTMERQQVESREYKIVLKARKFDGNEDELMAKAAKFWNLFQQAISTPQIGVRGHLDEVKTRRKIRFLDTAGHHLNNNSYLFRERVDIESEKHEFTLKFRHSDRYVA